MVICKRKSDSIVTSVQKSIKSFELRLELVNILLLDWIDCSENIPVYVLFTWWGSNGSFISPSVSHVDPC